MASRLIKEVGIGVAIAALIFLWLLREEIGALGLSPVSKQLRAAMEPSAAHLRRSSRLFKPIRVGW